MGVRRVQARAPRHDLPLRGVHPAEGDALSGEVRASRSRTRYFTWRNTKEELVEYFTELTQTDVREYMRPNLFANTPDILHAYLQRGGRPAFQVRLVLAATLGASYGIYSGFELVRERPAREGSEEYLDSEKYQIRPRNYQIGRTASPNSSARINAVRRDHPALQHDRGSRFTRPTTPSCSAYSKRSADGRDLILVIVNLDPLNMQHGFVQLPLAAWGFTPHATRSRSPICCRASGTSGGANGTTCGSIRRIASRTSCTCVAARQTCRPAGPAPHPVDADVFTTMTVPHARQTMNIDARRALVQRRRHLSGARPCVLRQQQRRRRRLPRPDAEARLPARPRHQLPLAAAVLPVAAQGRRLRHRRLREHPSELRHARRLRSASSPRRTASGIRVITELVINHTSDQHPWFQAARRAPAGSPERDFYVWSDTNQKYQGVRIIFTDTETSNWSWDDVAKAYYWHRFFHHQPDLNFDNPAVLERGHPGHAVLARSRRRRAAARRHPVPDRARRHDLREPRRDPRGPQEDPRGARRPLSGPHAPRRGQPVAGRRAARTSATATNATWRFTSR